MIPSTIVIDCPHCKKRSEFIGRSEKVKMEYFMQVGAGISNADTAKVPDETDNSFSLMKSGIKCPKCGNIFLSNSAYTTKEGTNKCLKQY